MNMSEKHSDIAAKIINVLIEGDLNTAELVGILESVKFAVLKSLAE